MRTTPRASVQTLTTPSGQKIGYSYSNNRIAGITINGTALIAAAITEPFGPLSTWQWGNGLVMLRVYDTDGRITSWEYRNGTSILRNNVSWDVASRVTGNTNPADATLGCAFQYDALDRLSVSQQGNPITNTQQFNYDKTGNRTNLTLNSVVTNDSTAPGSNQLLALTGGMARSYVYDAAGNPITIGGLINTYNNANRLVTVSERCHDRGELQGERAGAAGGEVASGITTRYIYDERDGCWASTTAPASSSRRRCGWKTCRWRHCGPPGRLGRRRPSTSTTSSQTTSVARAR